MHDSGGTLSKWASLKCEQKTITPASKDGSLGMWAMVNGAHNEFFTANGTAGQNISYKPLNMNNNDITTTTGTLDLTTTGTATNITVQPQNDNDVLITTTGVSGNQVYSASSGVNNTTQNITYNQWAVQTTGSVGIRTTGSSAIALEGQGSGGISINARYGGGTGNITTQGNIAVSTYDITGIGKIGITQGGGTTGLAGQSLVSGGVLGASYSC